MNNLNVMKFIKKIEENPVIWDVNNPIYYSSDLKKKAWKDVATHVNYPTDADSMSKLKRKWKKIRENYAKTKKFNESEDGVCKKRRKYIYDDLLQFLNVLDESDAVKSQIEEESEFEIKVEEIIDDENKVEAWQHEDPIKVPDKIEPKLHKVPVKVESKFDKQFDNTLLDTLMAPKDKGEDPERLYLLSLLPILKSFNEKQLLDYKIMNLKLFKYIKYENTEKGATELPSSVITYLTPKPTRKSNFQNVSISSSHR